LKESGDAISEDLFIELLTLTINKNNYSHMEFLLSSKSTDSLPNISHLILNAAGIGSIQIVQYFLNKKLSSISQSDDQHNTPLLWAAFNGHLKMVEFLLENGSSLSEKNSQGDNALLLAAHGGHLDIISYLYSKDPNLLSYKNTSGDNAISIAAFMGRLKIIEFLYDRNNWLISSANEKTGDTPLHLAAISGHKEIMEFILSKGTDSVNKVNGLGNSALLLSILYGHKPCVILLLEKGADPLLVNKEGENAMTVALALHNREFVSILATHIENKS